MGSDDDLIGHEHLIVRIFCGLMNNVTKIDVSILVETIGQGLLGKGS